MPIRPHPGPDHPLSSAPGQPLVAGPVCWRWESDEAETCRVPVGERIDEGAELRVALHTPWVAGRDDGDPRLDVTVGLVVDAEPVHGPLRDQHGHELAPTGGMRCLVPDQWNLLTVDLAPWAGRELDGIRLHLLGRHPDRGWVQAWVAPRPAPAERVTDWVDTRRGTHSSRAFSRGNTVPATAVPHGFNVLTPVTDARTTQWLYEWHPRGPFALQAVAFAHQPSPWIRDRGQLQLMPFLGAPDPDPGTRALRCSHDDELARAHVYAVRFEGGVGIRMVPTSRVGVFRFTFPAGSEPRGVVVDVPRAGGLRLGRTTSGQCRLTGWIAGDPDEVDLDAPREDTRRSPRGFLAGTTSVPVAELARTALDGGVQLVLGAEPGTTEIEVRIALSWIGVEQARRTLALEAPPEVSFAELERRAEAAWEALLGRAEVVGATADQCVTWYSNLYRMFLFPTEHHENAGDAAHPRWVHASPFVPVERPHTEERTGCRVLPGQLLVNNGYWDTYRTAWPAYHLLTPDLAPALDAGILQQYRDGGWMPRWSGPGAVDCMVGTSSDTIFADAASYGHLGDDESDAFRSAIRNASVPSRHPRVGRKGLASSRFRGWTSSDVPAGLSWTLESTICDAAVARWAADLAGRHAGTADGDEYRAWSAYLANRSHSHVTLFDPAWRLFRGRTEGGAWSREPFDPREWGPDHVETHAWGMGCAPVHDWPLLTELLGGPSGVRRWLEEFHATPETASPERKGGHAEVVHEMREARATGMGMLALSNQPAHHVPHFHAHSDAPWRGEAVTRDALDRLFVGSEIGQGYPGDEDNGELSAWWVWNALGLYPVVPGSGLLYLTAPLLPRCTWRFPGGGCLRVRADGVQHPYIQQVLVDGAPWRRRTIETARIARGLDLHVQLGPEPHHWATDGVRAPGAPLPRWRRDLATEATVGVSVGAAQPLVDDVGATAQRFGAGDWIQFRLPEAATVLTLTASGPMAWHLEWGGARGPVVRREFEPRQVVPFLLPADTREARIVLDAPATIWQLELLPIPVP